MTSGLRWAHFGMTLGSFYNEFGFTLEKHWDQFDQFCVTSKQINKKCNQNLADGKQTYNIMNNLKIPKI
jgi:hypothetical protein